MVQEMFDTMAAAGGAGLAAPQIGVDLQLVIFGFDRNERYPDAPPVPKTVLINPTITPLPEADGQLAEEDGWEGCLSVPEFWEFFERPRRVRVKYRDAMGAHHDEWFEGFPAVVLQHEMDHLEGVVIIDKASRLKRSRYLKKVKKGVIGGESDGEDDEHEGASL